MQNSQTFTKVKDNFVITYEYGIVLLSSEAIWRRTNENHLKNSFLKFIEKKFRHKNWPQILERTFLLILETYLILVVFVGFFFFFLIKSYEHKEYVFRIRDSKVIKMNVRKSFFHTRKHFWNTVQWKENEAKLI